MATLGELRAQIAERLQDTSLQSISASSVNTIINETISYYKFRRYWFNEKEATLSTTADSAVLSGIPSDFLFELSRGGLSVIDNQYVYPLQKVDTFTYDANDIGTRGIPSMYVYRDRTFDLYPIPERVYPVTLRYIKEYADLVNDVDSNDFTTIGERMVRYNALSRIYAEYKMDAQMEAYYTARADNEEQNLLKRSSALSGTGTLAVETRILG